LYAPKDKTAHIVVDSSMGRVGFGNKMPNYACNFENSYRTGYSYTHMG